MRPVVTLLLAVLAVPAFADDSYTIKIKTDPDVGKTVLVTSKSTETGSMKGFGGDGKLLFEDKKEGAEDSYRSTYLARGKDAALTRVVRVYEKATETRNGKTVPQSHQGRTFLLERVGTRPRVSVAGEAAIDPKYVEKLYKEGDERSPSGGLIEHLSPSKPVKVGDSWPVPIEALSQPLAGIPVDREKSTVTAKLVRVYQKGQSRFGTLEIRVRVILSGKADSNGVPVTIERPGESTADIILDLAIDGSSTERTEQSKSAMKVEASVPMPGGQTGRLVMDVQSTGIDQVSAETDDPKAREVGKVVYLPRPGEWTEFKPDGGLFTVDFPGPATSTLKYGPGYTERKWTVETNDHSAAYVIEVNDHSFPDGADPAAILKAVATQTRNVRRQVDVEVDGVKGIELTFSKEVNGKTYEYRQRVAATKQRSVHVVVAVQQGRPADVDRFFKSFHMNWGAKPPGPAWAEYRPADGSFVVQFPGPPNARTDKQDTYTEKRWFVEVDAGNMAYAVIRTEFANPDQVNPADVQKEMLAGYSNVRGKRDVNVGGLPGIEVTHDLEVKGVKLVVVERMAVTRDRVVQVVTIAVEGKTAQAAKFFDSFRFREPTRKADK